MKTKQNKQATQHIVIADRGWVWVGNVKETKDRVTISNARCIRRWGTTKGVGELAINGPQPETVLDPCGTVVVPTRAVIATILCKSNW